MALTGWSTSNYLTRAAAVESSYPFVVAAWINIPSAPGAIATILQLGTSGAATHLYADLDISTTPRVRAGATGATTISAASSTSNLGTNAWILASGEFTSTTDRAAQSNGANEGTNATSRAPNAPDITRVGIGTDTLLPFHATGGVGEISIWDTTGFTSGEIDSLQDELATLQGGTSAYNPLAIDAQAAVWAGKLLAYWRLSDSSDVTDLSGNGHALSLVGSLSTFGSSPPVDAVPSAGGSGAAFPRWRSVRR
jgi:hypothetical protein